MTIESPSRQDGASPFNRTAQHDAKRAAILSQAARLFNSQGSRATTLRDIAAGLGLTKTSLYYYVKTKEELIYQCYLAALEHHHHNLDVIERQHADPAGRVRAFFLRHFEDWQAARAGEAPHIAVLLEIAGLKGAHRQDIETRYVAMFKRLRDFLRAGIADGSLRPCETTSTTLALLGSLDWAFSWLHSVSPGEVAATAEQAWDILAWGIYGGTGNYIPARGSPGLDRAPALEGFNREQQNRRKQEAFFRTGTRFFNKQGFNGTSLDEIAEQLHVSKGAFYYHIRNKEDLLYSCYDYSLDTLEKIYLWATTVHASGLEKADRVCRRIFHVQNSSEGPLIRYSSITALPMPRRREILARTDAANARFGELLAEGIQDGSVRPINLLVAQNLLAGAINAAMDIELWRKVDNIDNAAIDYFDIFFNGLLPRG